MISLNKEKLINVAAEAGIGEIPEESFEKSERLVTLSLSAFGWEYLEGQAEIEDLPFDLAVSRLIENLAAEKFIAALTISHKWKQSKAGTLQSRRAKYVYFMRQGKNGPIKIGVAEDVEKRRKTLRTANAKKIVVLGQFPQTNEINEAKLHEKFEHLRLNGEWFKPAPELLAFVEALRERAERDE